MANTYHYRHALHSHHGRHLITGSVGLLVLGSLVGILVWQIHHNHHPAPIVQGATLTVPQEATTKAIIQVREPLYSFQLPGDWHKISSTTTPQLHNITWQATAKNIDARWLTVYVDTIPATLAVNRELPVSAQGNQLTYGSLSDDCANFTPGGTLDVAQAVHLKPTTSLWQGVTFICNLPQVVDNQTGTGSTGSINSVTVTGASGGAHNYFFLYTDHTSQPDYSILYRVMQTFRAT